ncbi:M20 family metallopeptidase [Ferrovibrio xuzhouensis]|uniref:M20 family metallopeptidase n=1 Tax=Ferrovibrio xuzhouensis TaxID=1576914 RepID=A0ABV7VBP0_9PROT
MSDTLDRPLDKAQITAAISSLRDEAITLLGDLVRHPSLLGDERSAQDHMRGVFEGMGLRVDEFAIDEAKIKGHPGYSPSIVSYDGRHNVVGVHEPKHGTHGKSLICNGHIDVVPVGAESLWTRGPFEPWIDGDRFYGRGAGDMKAGIVAYTMALKALQKLGYEPAAKVVLQSVVEEECTGNGALACLVEGYTADAAIIPEPTPGIMQAQMGVMWLAIEIAGKPVHASVAHTGVGAIDFATYMFSALKKLEARWNAPGHRHACYHGHEHPVNFNLGKITGGEWASSVPTAARADIRIGFYPGRKPEDVRAEIEAVLAEAYRQHPSSNSLRYSVVYEGFQAEGFALDMNMPVITTLSDCCREVLGKVPPYTAFTGTTDARFFNLYGNTPATCYGPHAENIHGIDEWVSIDSMMQVATVLALFMVRWCGVNRLDD